MNSFEKLLRRERILRSRRVNTFRVLILLASLGLAFFFGSQLKLLKENDSTSKLQLNRVLYSTKLISPKINDSVLVKVPWSSDLQMAHCIPPTLSQKPSLVAHKSWLNLIGIPLTWSRPTQKDTNLTLISGFSGLKKWRTWGDSIKGPWDTWQPVMTSNFELKNENYHTLTLNNQDTIRLHLKAIPWVVSSFELLSLKL